MSVISKNLYNMINSHVDKGNGTEYITDDGFPKYLDIFFASEASWQLLLVNY